MNFSIDDDGLAVTAVAAGNRVTLPEGSAGEPDIMIDNPGPKSVLVRAGGATVVTSATSMRIAPGEKSAYNKGEAMYLALAGVGGDQDVVIHIGSGS